MAVVLGAFIVLVLTACQSEGRSPHAPPSTAVAAPKQGLESFEAALQRQGIELTPTALREALKHPSEDVRRLAAWQLATNNVRSSVPAIREAMERATSPDTRVNMAAALANLGDTAGLATLRAICDNPEEKPLIRLEALRFSLDLDDKHCGGVALSLLDHADPDVAISAIRLVSYTRLRGSEFPDVGHKTTAALRHPSSSVRYLATVEAEALVGRPEAIRLLTDAAKTEQKPDIRQDMLKELGRLEAEAKGWPEPERKR